ncbi:hypothetical protein VNI00_015509 [Paramarasmius palmivorus]|uniref:Homeobox domain-containing protein n=1 Tax=Paramarasmius palmivorus TaxID=297713 RepID=A0AAW0BIS6_9AGAR
MSTKGLRRDISTSRVQVASPLSSHVSAPYSPASSTSSQSTLDDGTCDRPLEVARRKKYKVTPEQLTHLESCFATEHKPSTSRRKEISEMLGMTERQTQVWFQNRRTKMKVLTKKATVLRHAPKCPQSSEDSIDFFELALNHEGEDVEVVPCTNLAIGNWHYIATTSGRPTLAGCLCIGKQRLTWFITSAEKCFKIVLTFSSILEAHFASSSGDSGTATITLSEPPAFYQDDGVSACTERRSWRRCKDWIDYSQSTSILQHTVRGPAIEIARLVRTLSANRHYTPPAPRFGADIPLPQVHGLSFSSLPSQKLYPDYFHLLPNNSNALPHILEQRPFITSSSLPPTYTNEAGGSETVAHLHPQPPLITDGDFDSCQAVSTPEPIISPYSLDLHVQYFSWDEHGSFDEYYQGEYPSGLPHVGGTLTGEHLT